MIGHAPNGGHFHSMFLMMYLFDVYIKTGINVNECYDGSCVLLIVPLFRVSAVHVLTPISSQMLIPIPIANVTQIIGSHLLLQPFPISRWRIECSISKFRGLVLLLSVLLRPFSFVMYFLITSLHLISVFLSFGVHTLRSSTLSQWANSK